MQKTVRICSLHAFGSLRFRIALFLTLVYMIVFRLPLQADISSRESATSEFTSIASEVNDIISHQLLNLGKGDLGKPTLSGEPHNHEDQIAICKLPTELEQTLAARHIDISRLSGRFTAAGLILMPLDKSIYKLISHTDYDEKSDNVTEAVNKLGTLNVLLPILGGMYLLGDKESKETSKLCLAALVNAGIITQGIKIFAGRERPDVSDGQTRFHGFSIGDGHDSFPSGHTSTVFAVATVLAKKNPEQKWLYYGLASAVGLARIRKSAHFPSDVLAGAAVGTYAGERAVLSGSVIFGMKL
ncbi:MAG: phosphatase PAP2 family protein [Armatimonadota bacterium]|nr:phosphatase PAP2 family protein [Armatimonadota bacterium]